MQFRILVADDNAASRKALRATLAALARPSVGGGSGSGPRYEVEVVGSGRDALRRLLQDSFDLTLLDMHMPQLTGLQVLTHIRGAGCAVPSILMTGHPSRSIESAALEAGAAAMLRKPIPAEILRLTVDNILRRRSGAEPSSGPPNPGRDT